MKKEKKGNIFVTILLWTINVVAITFLYGIFWGNWVAITMFTLLFAMFFGLAKLVKHINKEP